MQEDTHVASITEEASDARIRVAPSSDAAVPKFASLLNFARSLVSWASKHFTVHFRWQCSIFLLRLDHRKALIQSRATLSPYFYIVRPDKLFVREGAGSRKADPRVNILRTNRK